MNHRALERVTKGVANHRRIQIMELIHRAPRLSVVAIARELHVNYKTVSEHLRRLTHAGLIEKRNMGAEVEHTLSPQGNLILKFLRTLE